MRDDPSGERGKRLKPLCSNAMYVYQSTTSENDPQVLLKSQIPVVFHQQLALFAKNDVVGDEVCHIFD